MKALFLALAAAFSENAVEKTLEAELAETRTPGAALVIVRGQEVLLSKGFGIANVETGEPVTPDHLFRLGSTTKLFTATALATLAEQGRIDLLDGALFLEQSGGRLPVARRGADLFSAQPPGGRPAIPFRILPGADGKGELLQMFLWLFKKEKVAP